MFSFSTGQDSAKKLRAVTSSHTLFSHVASWSCCRLSGSGAPLGSVTADRLALVCWELGWPSLMGAVSNTNLQCTGQNSSHTDKTVPDSLFLAEMSNR